MEREREGAERDSFSCIAQKVGPGLRGRHIENFPKVPSAVFFFLNRLFFFPEQFRPFYYSCRSKLLNLGGLKGMKMMMIIQMTTIIMIVMMNMVMDIRQLGFPTSFDALRLSVMGSSRGNFLHCSCQIVSHCHWNENISTSARNVDNWTCSQINGNLQKKCPEEQFAKKDNWNENCKICKEMIHNDNLQNILSKRNIC